MNDQLILQDPGEYPDEKVLGKKMGDLYLVYSELVTELTSPPRDLNHEWRYYRDGKAWLCRVGNKKKTVLWISVLEGYFKVAFYFSAKAGEGIEKLEIAEDLKSDFRARGFIGKVKPLVIRVSDQSRMGDILKIAEYKTKI
jgi:hypothetical protein